MLTITNHTLEKLELLVKSSGYKIRYERGNFKSGLCMLLDNRIIIINKFSNLESRIHAMAELVRELEIDHNLLDEKQNAFLKQLKQNKSAL